MNEDIEVRSCALAECEEVLELWRAHHPPGIPARLEDIQRLVQQYPDQLLIARAGGQLVGAVIAAWDGAGADICTIWRCDRRAAGAVSPAH